MTIPIQKNMEIPFLKLLKEQNGKIIPKVMYRLLGEYFNLNKEDLNEKMKDGRNHWENAVQFVRNTLKDKGFINGEMRGIWKITAKGEEELMRSNSVIDIFGNKYENKVKLGIRDYIGEEKMNNYSDVDIKKEYSKLYDLGQIEFITFHPAYSYEEFIEGITVDTTNDKEKQSEIKYILKEGLFKGLCKKALASAINLAPADAESKKWSEIYALYSSQRADINFEEADKYVLIIDEINRGDIAKIFGELITLLENDKRLAQENELVVKLPLSGDYFAVPPNLYIIATMNTADRSIALLDVALRRRFGFIEMKPDFKILKNEYIEKNRQLLIENNVYESLSLSIEKTEIINKKISADKSIGIDRQIGHSFFFKIKDQQDLIMVWKYEILPLLEEYCYGDYAKINRILFNQEKDSEWISETEGIKDINDISSLNSFLNEIKEKE